MFAEHIPCVTSELKTCTQGLTGLRLLKWSRTESVEPGLSQPGGEAGLGLTQSGPTQQVTQKRPRAEAQGARRQQFPRLGLAGLRTGPVPPLTPQWMRMQAAMQAHTVWVCVPTVCACAYPVCACECLLCALCAPTVCACAYPVCACECLLCAHSVCVHDYSVCAHTWTRVSAHRKGHCKVILSHCENNPRSPTQAGFPPPPALPRPLKCTPGWPASRAAL